MDVLDHKEGWVLKNWCFWSVVLEKTFGSPLDCKEVKPINPKGNQPWIFIERTDAEAEASILWPPDAKSRLTGKDPDAGEEWGQKEKQATEDKMTGWLHQLSGPEFEQTLELVKDREAWHATVHGVAKSRKQRATEQQQNNQMYLLYFKCTLNNQGGKKFINWKILLKEMKK